jgi:hypothetical protein
MERRPDEARIMDAAEREERRTEDRRQGCSEGPRCPSCSGSHSKVLQSRIPAVKADYYRRRQCADCGTKFTTHETVKEVA